MFREHPIQSNIQIHCLPLGHGTSPKPMNFQLTVIIDQKKQKNLQFQKLERVNLQHFGFKITWKDHSVIQTVDYFTWLKQSYYG